MEQVLCVYENDNALAEKQRVEIILEEIFTKYRIAFQTFVMESQQESTELTNIILKEKPEYLCTIDMAGFQIGTLQDIPFYDICPSKQIHIVLNESIFTKYEKQPFALNLYMVLPGDTSELQKRYTDIINICGYGRLTGEEDDKEILDDIIYKVISEVNASKKLSIHL